MIKKAIGKFQTIIFFLLLCLAVSLSAGLCVTASAEEAPSFITSQEMTAQATERGTLLSGDGGAYYSVPVNALRQVDVDISVNFLRSGDIWGTLCFYGAPATGLITHGGANGIVLLLRNAGGFLNVQLYKYEAGVGFSIVRENNPTTAATGEVNRFSLVRVGSKYTILINDVELTGFRDLIEENFASHDFLTTEGQTYVAFGSFHGGVEFTVSGISNPLTETDEETWEKEEGTLNADSNGILIASPFAVNTIARDANCVTWQLGGATVLAEGGYLRLGLQKRLSEKLADNLYFELKNPSAVTLDFYLAGELLGSVETQLPIGQIKKLVLRNFEDCYRMEINDGAYLCYVPVTIDRFTRSKNRTEVYASVSTDGHSALYLELIDSSDGSFDKPAEYDIRKWNNYSESVEEYDDKIILRAPTYYTERLNAEKISVTFTVDWAQTKRLVFAIGANGFTPAVGEGGAKGVLFSLTPFEGKLWLDGFLTTASASRQLLSAYRLDRVEQFTFTIKNITGGGLAVAFQNERILVGGKDPFAQQSKSDIANAAGYALLSVGVGEGERVQVDAISSWGYDTDPVVKDNGLVGGEGLGMNAQDWLSTDNGAVKEDGVFVNEKGGLNLCHFMPSNTVTCNTLLTPLNCTYLDFTIDIETLLDSTLQDAYFAFALGTSPEASLALPDGNVFVNADCVTFIMKNVGGILYLGIYQRYGGAFTQLQGLKAFYPEATGVYKFAIVYYEYEMSLFVNGERYLDENDSNPLKDVCLANFSKDKKTYFATAFFSNAADVKGPAARSVVLYDMNDTCTDGSVYRILDQYNFEITNRVIDTDDTKKKFDVVTLTGCLITFGVIAAAGGSVAVVFFVVAKRRKEHE